MTPAVEQNRGVTTQAAEQVLDVVRGVVAALEDVHLVLLLRIGKRRSRGAGTAVVELAGIAGDNSPIPATATNRAFLLSKSSITGVARS